MSGAAGKARRKGHGRMSAKLRFPILAVLLVWTVLGLLAAWSAIAEVDRVVRAQGRIVPAEMPQFVQHLEGGVISRVFVREGDRIAAGAPIASISGIEAEAAVNERRLRIAALSAEAHRLQAEAGGTRPDWAAFTGDSTLATFVAQQDDIYRARAATLALTLGSLGAQRDQKTAEIAGTRQRLDGLRAELSIAAQKRDVVRNMVDRDAGSRLELLEAEGRVAQFESQIADLEAALPRLGFEQEELAQRQDEAAAEFAQAALQRLSDVQLEIDQLAETVAAADDRLLRTVVLSPVDGVVNRVFATTIGGVVRPGDPVVEITPDSDILILEGWIDPAERGAVFPGQPAIVRVSAYDFAVHGALHGNVVEISADTVERREGPRQYRLRVVIDEDSYRAFGQPVSAGMDATADVVIGRRTVLQYLAAPILRGFDTALRDRK